MNVKVEMPKYLKKNLFMCVLLRQQTFLGSILCVCVCVAWDCIKFVVKLRHYKNGFVLAITLWHKHTRQVKLSQTLNSRPKHRPGKHTPSSNVCFKKRTEKRKTSDQGKFTNNKSKRNPMKKIRKNTSCSKDDAVCVFLMPVQKYCEWILPTQLLSWVWKLKIDKKPPCKFFYSSVAQTHTLDISIHLRIAGVYLNLCSILNAINVFFQKKNVLWNRNKRVVNWKYTSWSTFSLKSTIDNNSNGIIKKTNRNEVRNFRINKQIKKTKTYDEKKKHKHRITCIG